METIGDIALALGIIPAGAAVYFLYTISRTIGETMQVIKDQQHQLELLFKKTDKHAEAISQLTGQFNEHVRHYKPAA